MNLILFGFKGSGKTYLGKRLSLELGCPFLDVDDLMVQLYAEESGENLNIRALYQLIGEKEFRVLETRTISGLLKTQDSIISLGGGSVLSRENVEMLQTIGTLVYLDVSLETIQKRGVTSAIGPLETLYMERLPLYKSIPACSIEVDCLNEKEILTKLSSIFNRDAVFYGI